MAINVGMHARWLSPYYQQMASFYVAALALAIALLTATIGLHQLLRPVDKLSPPAGKKWQLPPGPAGWPLIGNLLQYGKGEAAVGHPLPNR